MSSDCGVKCSATQCGLRVKRLKAERCEGVVRVSATGPGKPYRSIPAGSTGETTVTGAGWVDAATGTGSGVGGGGIDGTVGERASFDVDVGVDIG